LGFTLTRTIPTKVLIGVLTGAYQIFGGVVRSRNGQIVAHLINGISPLDATAPLNTALSAINTYQLHRMGRDVANAKQAVDAIGVNVDTLMAVTNHLIGLATGTMLLSGLTLAVSAAGFAFLNRKLNKIDRKLQELQQDVKEIKAFLNTRQRAELTTALNTLRDVSDAPSDDTRRHLLVNSRQTLGTLHHHYKSQFIEAGHEGILSAAEEYFTVTAIAHALCAGELDMHDTAASDLEESYACWSQLCRKIAREKLLRADPERYLSRRFASAVRTDELIDWMEFAHDEDKGLDWIDQLRTRRIDPWLARRLSRDELMDTELLRRLASRNRIYQSYCCQYQHFKQHKHRPSVYQQQIDKLDRSALVRDTYLFVSSEVAALDQPA
jgi:hypothetical protein